MSAPRANAVAPYGWCAVLAAADDDVLGAALAEVCARHRVRSPELMEVTHYRHQGPREEHGVAWFLFVAAVMADGPSGPWEGDLADTHPALARDLWHVCERWGHAFPTFRRFAPGAPQLGRYHRPRPGVVLPAPPPERPRPSHVTAPATRRAETEAPKAAPAIPEQRGLFG